MKKLGKFLQSRLFDVAPAPVLLSLFGVGFLLALFVTALIVTAVALTVRAVKRSRAKSASEHKDQAQ